LLSPGTTKLSEGGFWKRLHRRHAFNFIERLDVGGGLAVRCKSFKKKTGEKKTAKRSLGLADLAGEKKIYRAWIDSGVERPETGRDDPFKDLLQVLHQDRGVG